VSILHIIAPYMAVAAGSALGALGRFALSVFLTRHCRTELPVGTLCVNIIGSFLIGALAAVGNLDSDGVTTAFLGHGLLGGFTTVSTFSIQTLTHLQQGKGHLAIANIVLSVLSCLLAAWLGWTLFG